MATRKILGLWNGLLILGIVWLVAPTAHAMILVHDGNDPVQDRGWPTGAEEVANLPSRLGFMEGPPFGGGEYYFKYACKGTAEFNEALRKFGAIRAPRTARRLLISLDGQGTWLLDAKPLLLVVHDWTEEAAVEHGGRDSAKEKERVDWTFTVWVPESFHRLFSDPAAYFSDHPNFRQPVPPPRIDTYVGGRGPLVWEQVVVPPNIRVIDERTEAAPVSVDDGGASIGAVFDMATHQVIVDAEVVLLERTEPHQWEEHTRTRTDANGSFEILAVPKGYYEIHIGADGYADRNVTVFHNRDGHSYCEFDALLMKTASCKGVVRDTQGHPIPGVKVSAHEMLGIDGLGYECPTDPSATTDDNGCFVLQSLPGGFTHIRCRAPSLHQQTSIFERYDVRAEPWRERETITIVMSGTGTVRGRVVGEDGRPPARPFIAEIEPPQGNRVGTWGGSMQCQADGSFEFKGVPPGEYVVTAKPNPMREGEASAPKPVTVTPGKTVELEIVSAYAHDRKRR